MRHQFSEYLLQGRSVERIVRGRRHADNVDDRARKLNFPSRPFLIASFFILANPGRSSAVVMSMKRFRTLLVVTMGILQGCATFSVPVEVSTSLIGVRPRQADVFETTIEVTLRFTNEAARPLTLAGSSHRLYVNESYIGAAVNGDRLTIPSLGTATQMLIFHLENLALAGKIRELANASAINYRLESQLHPADLPGAGRLKVSTTGKVDLGALKAAAGL